MALNQGSSNQSASEMTECQHFISASDNMPTKAKSKRVSNKKSKQSVRVSRKKQAKRDSRKTKPKSRKRSVPQSKLTGGWQWPWSKTSSAGTCTNAQTAFADVYQKYLQWDRYVAAKNPIVFIRSGPQRGQIAPNPYATACLQQWQVLQNAHEQLGCSPQELDAQILSGWNPVTDQPWSESAKNPKAYKQRLDPQRATPVSQQIRRLNFVDNPKNASEMLQRRPRFLPPLQQPPLPPMSLQQPVRRVQRLDQRPLPLMQQRLRMLRPLQAGRQQLLQQQEQIQQQLDWQKLRLQQLRQQKNPQSPIDTNLQNQFVNYRPASAYVSKNQLQPEASLNTPRYWKR